MDELNVCNTYESQIAEIKVAIKELKKENKALFIFPSV